MLDRERQQLEHRRFTDLLDYLAPGDALVVNATQVFKARLLGQRESGRPAEVFLLRPLADGSGAGGALWEAMVQPGAKLRPGRRVQVSEGFAVDILDTTPRHTRVVQLVTDPDRFATPGDAIARCGHVPLPPYITRADTAADSTRYQTVYARTEGSVAAPTAGLHFTDELLARVSERGVERIEVVLHVGAGTFRPVQDDDPSRHVMHEEWYEVTEQAAAAIARTRANGGRLWAVGTTAVRTLESAADADGVVRAGASETNLFIRPPQRLRVVDRLLTNFHQPRSTLLMLVASFAGYEFMMSAYREAVAREYRFLSYGDSMCIL